MDVLLLLGTTYACRISQAQETEAVMLQPPYLPIKIAESSGFYGVSKLLNSVPVENSQLFHFRVTIQASTIFHILCWICVNFRVKSMHIVGFAPLSIGICPCYKPEPDLLIFELSQWWRVFLTPRNSFSLQSIALL